MRHALKLAQRARELGEVPVGAVIVDAKGEAFTDASSWFWAAALGQSTGPWRAVTVARAL